MVKNGYIPSVHAGQVTYGAVARDLGYDHAPAQEVLAA